MHSVTLAQNPNAFIIALIAGTLPALLWLFFWLREDGSGQAREPRGLVMITFFAGMLSVLLVLPVQKLIAATVSGSTTQIVLWAASEEVVKYLAFAVIMVRNPYLDEPADYAIYLISAGLGFAALENAMYLFNPLASSNTTVSFLTGNMRFLGSTLLHAVTTGLVGVSMGLAFFRGASVRSFFRMLGLGAAIALHSVFNFFIMQKNGENFIQVFGFLWVVTIIIMLLFERLRRMGAYVQDVAYPVR